MSITVPPGPGTREDREGDDPQDGRSVDRLDEHHADRPVWPPPDWRGTIAGGLVRAWQQPGPGEFPRVLTTLVVVAFVAAVVLVLVLALR
jgi:hypothetical protein